MGSRENLFHLVDCDWKMLRFLPMIIGASTYYDEIYNSKIYQDFGKSEIQTTIDLEITQTLEAITTIISIKIISLS
jgi:hypothetical protein